MSAKCWNYHANNPEFNFIKKVGYYPLFTGIMFGFFICLNLEKMFRCRDPPMFNLNVKKI